MIEQSPRTSDVPAAHVLGVSSLNQGSWQASSGMVEVHVENADEVDEALNNAMLKVTEAATRHRVGIMITRLGAGWYVVRAHPEVPFGLTRQQHR